MSVRTVAEALKRGDHLLVRYATGALRNIAVDEMGRRAILAQQVGLDLAMEPDMGVFVVLDCC